MSIWSVLEEGENTTLATEVPGVGVVLAVPGAGVCFVPGSRLRPLRDCVGLVTHQITKEDRTVPPVRGGLTAAEIVAKAPGELDPGARSYLVLDDEAAGY